jgi:hypothetical protein
LEHILAYEHNRLLFAPHGVPGDFLDALRHVHDVANQSIVDASRSSDIANYRAASMDADADSYGGHAKLPLMPIVVNDRRRDRASRTTGARGMIWLPFRCAPKGHQRVANELIYSAVFHLHAGSQKPKMVIEESRRIGSR